MIVRQVTPNATIVLIDLFQTLQIFLKLTDAEPFAAWFVVTEDATPDGIRVLRSVLGAIGRNATWKEVLERQAFLNDFFFWNAMFF